MVVAFFLLGSLTPIREDKVVRSWAPPKNCSSEEGGFGLKNYHNGELGKGKKMLFQHLN
jgi:hypothetical protein